MTQEAVFPVKLEPELREYGQHQHNAVGYDEYLARKVAAGRTSMQAGQGRSNEEVEAEFAARRAAASQS
jgi:hypothetical protein